MSWSPKKLRKSGLLLMLAGTVVNFIANDREREERNEGYRKALVDTADAAATRETNKRFDLWEYRQIKDKSEEDEEN